MKKYNTFRDSDLLSFSIFSMLFSIGLGYYSIKFYFSENDNFLMSILGLSSLGFLFASVFVLSKWKKTKDIHINELEQNKKNDYLTKIPNGIYFSELLRKAIEKLKEDNDKNNDDKNLYLLIIGLDRFSFIADTFGYTFSNEVLVKVKDELKTVISDNDCIGRLTGDEFGIFTYKRKEEILPFIKEITSLFGKNYEINKKESELFINARIGISSYSSFNEQQDEELLIHKAKVALESAKKEYNCSFKIHNQTLEREKNEDLELEKDLRKSIINKELFVVFQPKINAKTMKVEGAEALVRWFSKKRNSIITPDVFIPIAEEIGFISNIGEFVLEQSLIELNKWHKLGYKDLKVAVNISTKQFTNNLPNKIMESLKRNEVSSEFLELEVTESALVSDKHNGTELLYKIKELGVSIAIDDFGTGYSSLSYLINFPLDVVKIDKSFVDKIIDKDSKIQQKGSAVVSTVIHLAHKIDCKVVAEGVETKEQVDALLAESCDIMQGYYYSKPLNEKEFVEFIKKFN